MTGIASNDQRESAGEGSYVAVAQIQTEKVRIGRTSLVVPLARLKVFLGQAKHERMFPEGPDANHERCTPDSGEMGRIPGSGAMAKLDKAPVSKTGDSRFEP